MNHRMSHRVVILDRVQSECYNLSPAPRCTSSSLADLATTYKPTRPATGRANHYLVVRATLSYGMQFCTNLSESDVNSSSSLDQKKRDCSHFFLFKFNQSNLKLKKRIAFRQPHQQNIFFNEFSFSCRHCWNCGQRMC